MPATINLGGAQHSFSPFTNISGAWHSIAEVYVNIGGTWRTAYVAISISPTSAAKIGKAASGSFNFTVTAPAGSTYAWSVDAHGTLSAGQGTSVATVTVDDSGSTTTSTVTCNVTFAGHVFTVTATASYTYNTGTN